jgi:subtilisin family serine protease
MKKQMKNEYAIVRAKRAKSTQDPFTMGPLGFGAAMNGQPATEPLEIAIDRDALSQADLVKLHAEPSVAGIAPIMKTRLIAPVGDPVPAAAAATEPWGLSAVKATTSSRNGAGVVVAVLDTGIDDTHAAFPKNQIAIDFTDFSGSGPGDVVGHGTHCAGTIFGRPVGGVRIGVAPGVTRALIGKVLGNDGSGTSDGILQGLQWAAVNGANVISMSLGYDFTSTVEFYRAQGMPEPAAVSQTLIDYRANLRLFDTVMSLLAAMSAFGHDCVVVAASGNESARPEYKVAASLPAAALGIISVGAVGRDGTRFSIAPFSNYLPQLCGPGVDVVSARAGGGLTSMSGTSMATPHAAGIAALHWQALGPLATGARVTAAMLNSARPGALSPDTQLDDMGSGLITAPA